VIRNSRFEIYDLNSIRNHLRFDYEHPWAKLSDLVPTFRRKVGAQDIKRTQTLD